MKNSIVQVKIYIGPDLEYSGATAYVQSRDHVGDWEPYGIDVCGRGPRHVTVGHTAEAWLAWGRRVLQGEGIAWADAEVKPCAPGEWFNATHGIEVWTQIRRKR